MTEKKKNQENVKSSSNNFETEIDILHLTKKWPQKRHIYNISQTQMFFVYWIG